MPLGPPRSARCLQPLSREGGAPEHVRAPEAALKCVEPAPEAVPTLTPRLCSWECQPDRSDTSSFATADFGCVSSRTRRTLACAAGACEAYPEKEKMQTCAGCSRSFFRALGSLARAPNQ